MTIGENIRLLRKEQNLTQQSLATQTGIPVRTIINYENSAREPNAKNMATLERFFCVSGEYLRGDSNDRLPAAQWDDPEIMEAVRESLPIQISSLNDILKGCSAQEQKLTFDILVELSHVLRLEGQQHRESTISLLQSVFSASTRYVDVCMNAAQDIEPIARIEKTKRATLAQYDQALDEALIFLQK